MPLGIGFIALFTAVNYFGIVPGAVVQNVFTLLKLLALGLLIGAGILLAPAVVRATPPTELVAAPLGVLGRLGAALIPVMFAIGGWQNSNFIGAEIRNPGRNLPRAIVIGVLVVVAVYLMANVAYLRALGVEGLAQSAAPAADTLAATIGSGGAALIRAGIVVSTLGILNLFILAAPRVYQAMADDGLFFRAASRLHPRYRTPSGALLFQAAWATVLALSGTYGQLLDYVVFGDWIFFGLVAATLFVYRARDRAGTSRTGNGSAPFLTPMYPLVPLLFVVAAAAIVVSSILSNPGNAGLGAVLIALGVPVFLLWRRKAT